MPKSQSNSDDVMDRSATPPAGEPAIQDRPTGTVQLERIEDSFERRVWARRKLRELCQSGKLKWRVEADPVVVSSPPTDLSAAAS